MSKLSVDETSIFKLFSEKHSDFLIPDYQRPYAWGEEECETLWDDIFAFAFPDDDYSKFNSNDEYFLGPIVTFKNDDGKLEIIDGQQRLTTLMLLLRAFYSRFGNMKDSNSISTADNVAKCIWKTDEFGNPNKSQLKIESESSSDEDKDEFLSILKNGQVLSGQRSRYAVNYQFFVQKIDDFLKTYPSYFAYLPTRIMNNCILLPIEADSQDMALRIFSTINDRGKPLSDTDIFKAQFYNYYKSKGEKDQFIKRWKELESICDDMFFSANGSPMDELFTRYMYFQRAKQGIKGSTTEALRSFYEKNKYALLKNKKTLSDLESLASFFRSVDIQDDSVFSDEVLKQLGVLRFAPNGMWTYLLSVYYLQNKDQNGVLDNDSLIEFLNTIILFIFSYALMHPGVIALRTPAYPEMINIVNGKKTDFRNYRFDESVLRQTLIHYEFTNNRTITKSILAWWMYHNPNQALIPSDTTLEVEHIYPRKRQENEKSLTDSKNLESLGNKALLEKSINIRASDYRFPDKKKYYLGFVTEKGRTKAGTLDNELTTMTDQPDFTEQDIISRKSRIIDAFIDALKQADLLN